MPTLPAGERGVNFAIFSESAKSVDLCIYFDEASGSRQPSLRIPLDRDVNRTGDGVWWGPRTS